MGEIEPVELPIRDKDFSEVGKSMIGEQSGSSLRRVGGVGRNPLSAAVPIHLTCHPHTHPQAERLL